MADEASIEPTVVEPVEAAEPTTETSEQEAVPVDPAELERLRTALKSANKEAEKHRLRLKEVDDAKLSEVEKAKRDAQEANQRADKLERSNLLATVALEEGIPAKWVPRLVGDTEEELRADAQSILADLNKTRKPAPDPSQGPRTNPAVSGKEKGRAEALKRFGPK